MKNQSHSNLIARSSIALTLALFVWAPLNAQSTPPAEGKMMMGGKMMEAHPKMTGSQETMMQHHQAMMADLKAQDAEIATQVAKMNSAPAGKKLDLMAAIVTRMAEQRTAMNARMGLMQGEMMQCAMDSTAMGENSSSPHSMMKGMDGKMGADKK